MEAAGIFTNVNNKTNVSVSNTMENEKSKEKKPKKWFRVGTYEDYVDLLFNPERWRRVSTNNENGTWTMKKDVTSRVNTYGPLWAVFHHLLSEGPSSPSGTCTVTQKIKTIIKSIIIMLTTSVDNNPSARRPHDRNKSRHVFTHRSSRMSLCPNLITYLPTSRGRSWKRQRCGSQTRE